MATKQAYKDWNRIARESLAIAQDKALPLWEKGHLVGEPYTELALEDLQSKHRRKILNGFAKINAILKKYPLTTFDDYKNISENDLREIISLVKSMAPA